MINDDCLVKYARKQLASGHTLGLDPGNWPDYVRFLKEQILEIKLGFAGLGSNDLAIIQCTQIEPGQRVILSDNLDANSGFIDTDHAPIMCLVESIDPGTGDASVIIEGIGAGLDFTRDPDRLLRWGQRHIVSLSAYPTVLQVLSTPKPDGGSMYYYFNKNTRDSRW